MYKTAVEESSRPLVTDMDGTLLKTDTLWEGFFAALGEKPWILFLLPLWLVRGRLFFKQQLAGHSAAHAETYPVNQAVLEVLEAASRNGRELYLASAACRPVTEAVARRFGCFTAVFASEDGQNLKGSAKAELLRAHFGERGFDYIGDANADMPVWQAAGTAWVVAPAGSHMVKKVQTINSDCKVIETASPGAKDYYKALRIHQWIKNILIFVPMLLAHRFTLPDLGNSFIAFLAFSCCSSAIYIVNDLCDLATDRQHRSKKKRPFAAVKIPLRTGVACFFLCLAAACFFSFFLPFKFLLSLVGYLVLTTSYTLCFKQRLFADVIVLACLYVMRLVAGATALDCSLSNWLLSFGVFIFLGLALLKRVGDLIQHESIGNLPGRAYLIADKTMLEIMAACSGFSSIVVAGLYVDSMQAIQLYSYPYLLWGVCFVLAYWFGRLCILVHRGEVGDDPVAFAVKDRASYVCFLVIAALSFLAI